MTTEKKVFLSLIYGTAFCLVVLHFDSVSANFTGTICPDSRFKCQEGQTCCSIGPHKFGCCPYDNGVCCNDKKSCCPNGFNCDEKEQKCTRKREHKKKQHQPFVLIELPTIGSNTTLFDDDRMENELTMESQIENGKKTCPDGKQTCPESYTCCAQASGGYGCCPLTGGICCPDKVHCCPIGTQCNTLLGSCEA